MDLNLEQLGVNQKYDPFNKNNVLLTKKDVVEIFKRARVDIKESDLKNLDYFQVAFVHKSYSLKKFKEANVPLEDNNGSSPDLQYNDYEVDEFLGDRVTDLAVVQYLIKRFPTQGQGFYTNLKTKVVSGEFMGAKYARSLGLSKYVMISRHVELKEGRGNDKILEDVFEAFVGAAFKEFGYPFCEKFIQNILEDNVDFSELIMHDNNYKDMIVKYFQRNKMGHAKFVEKEVKGPVHDRIYTVEIQDSNGTVYGIGTEKNKKKAEQVSAHKACIHFGLVKN